MGKIIRERVMKGVWQTVISTNMSTALHQGRGVNLVMGGVFNLSPSKIIVYIPFFLPFFLPIKQVILPHGLLTSWFIPPWSNNYRNGLNAALIITSARACFGWFQSTCSVSDCVRPSPTFSTRIDNWYFKT